METKIVLELITSILEALSGYIVGKGFRDKKYTYSRIIIVASIISIIFFLMHSCYEILFGQKVRVFKDNYIFTEKDIYLVVTPDGVLVRRLKIIDETVFLICTNKSCNNEKYLVDGINIIGKVSV